MDPYTELLVAMRQIIKATDFQSKRIARDAGVTTAQLLALQVIEAEPGIAVGEIARAMNLTQATMTSIVNRMESHRMIKRTRDKSDRRKVRISLTAAGARVLERAPRALQDLLRQRFEALESWEQMQLLSAVQRLARMMDAEDIEAAPMLETGQIDSANATVVKA